MAGLTHAEATMRTAAAGARGVRAAVGAAAPDRVWLESLLQNFDELSSNDETIHCSEALLRAAREHLSRHPMA